MPARETNRLIPSKANRRTHLTFRELWRPQLVTIFMYLGIVGVFFAMDWHVPEQWQAFVSVALYVPCQWTAYWIFYSVAGIYTAN